MKLENLKLSQHDESVRKCWLIGSICLYTFPILLFLYLFSIAEVISDDLIKFFLIIVGLNAFKFWLIWYVAYWRRETTLLSIFLIVGPIATLTQFFQLFKEPNTVDFVGFILEAIIYVCWYVLSLRLLKINKKLLVKGSPEYPACLESMREMENAIDLTDLNAKFSALIKRHPKFEAIYTDKYREKSLEFAVEKG